VPDLQEIYHSLVDGAVYDVARYLFGPVVVTVVFALLGKYLEWFKSLRALFFVSVGVFVVALTCFSIFAPRAQSPQLAGTVESVVAGPLNEGSDTIAVFVVDVLNSGSMQSIVKNWTVTATINSRNYQGAFIVPAPPNFTFTKADHNQSTPSGITYHGDDNLLDKTNFPIPSGGLSKGVLFVLFRGVSPDVFKTGADYTVSYEDALSKKYSAYITATAQIGAVPLATGIHAELMCPVQNANSSGAASPNIFTPLPPKS
jgi:hypothetical protein